MSIELNKSLSDGKYHVKTSFPKLKEKLELPTQEVTFDSYEKMALAKKESYDEILNRKFDEMSDIIRGEKDDV